MIGIAALVTFGVLSLAELEKNDRLPSTDQWLGFTMAFVVASALADLGVPLGGGLSLLLMTAVLVTRGDEAFRFAFTATARAQRQTRQRDRARRKPRGKPTRPSQPARPGGGSTLS